MIKQVDFEVADWGELASGPTTWSGYASQVLSLGPGAYWREMDVGAGVIEEVTGQGPSLSLVGEPGLVDGAVKRDASGGWRLTPGQDWVQAGSHVMPPGGGASYTLLLWVRLGAADWGICVADHGSEWWLLVESAGKLHVMINGLSRMSLEEPSLRDGQWHHLAMTRAADGALGLWYDGGLVDTGSYASSIISGAAGFRLGHESIGTQFDMDEAALFEHVLAAEQIVDLYRRGRGVLAGSL